MLSSHPGADTTRGYTKLSQDETADPKTSPAGPKQAANGRAPFCSIIVTSYNKGEFVPLAVESALSQTYPNTEVIVVDDGSTDNSLAALELYHDRVTLISKVNGGQASAMNQGFSVSRGDIVLFLDCDDLLDPETMERVVAAWGPHVAKVHFRLRTIRRDGSVVDGAFMPPYRPLVSGEIDATFRRFGFYPAPPTTGNAFARRVLQAVMPLPEATYRAWADTPIVGIAPLFGQVLALDGNGGSWRRTTDNYSSQVTGVDEIATRMACDDCYISMFRHHDTNNSYAGFAGRWPMYLKDRLIFAKFSSAVGSDAYSPARLAWRYLWAVAHWPEYTWRRRLLLGAWAIALGIVPQALLRRVPGIAGARIRVS
jgi:glycosyltransferase involved in cell wall biosynthesis